MKYKEAVLLCVEYIEKNLKNELSTEVISREIGYSVYHFSRIFKEEMGISLMEYVKERKLLRAAEEIMSGKRILDTAIEYGYETHSGFTKAFRKKYGFSPAFIHALSIEKLFNENGGNYNMSQDKIYEKTNMFLKATENNKNPDELYKCLIESIQRNKLFEDFTRLEKAYNVALSAHKDQKRKSGEEYVTHCINVAIILAEMEADEDTIISGLLHDVIEEKTPVTLKELEERFSEKISTSIDKVTNFNKNYLEITNGEEFKESVIMIKLADRLHNMRTIEFMSPERWKEKSKETLEIFSPIAAKFNNSKLKSELDNLALKYI